MKVLLGVIGIVSTVVVGAVVGALGSVAHWANRPWGLVVSLVLVVTSTTTVRAWAGRRVIVAHLVGMGAVIALLARPGPGGDVLIHLSSVPAHGVDPAVFGRIWVVGSLVATVAVAVAPGALFSDRPATLWLPWRRRPAGGEFLGDIRAVPPDLGTGTIAPGPDTAPRAGAHDGRDDEQACCDGGTTDGAPAGAPGGSDGPDADVARGPRV
ncbi:MAG: hypothetical protein FWE61_09850 [Micrococcales bacterium]|nr:hypothetical protein [Micrococcales bacterium]